KRVSVWLKANDIGRTAMIILPRNAAAGTARHGGDTIADHLGVSGEVADVLRNIFPREMSARLVRDLGVANAGEGETFVNYDCDILIGGRMFIAGKRTSGGKNESLLAFKRELSELEKECSRLAAEIDTATSTAESARSELVDNESKTVDLQSLIIKVDRGIHGLQIQLHAAQEESTRAERHRKVVDDETGQIKAEIA